MKAEVLVIWLGLTLCWVVVCAREDAEGEVQVGRRQGLEDGRQVDQRDVEMSDDPAGEVEVEKPKPKKKKTPEEIEAGMSMLRVDLNFLWEHILKPFLISAFNRKARPLEMSDRLQEISGFQLLSSPASNINQRIPCVCIHVLAQAPACYPSVFF